VRRQAAALAMTLFSIAACAPAAPAAAPAPRAATTTAPPPVEAADCTRASKVTIAADGSITPRSLSLQRGAFIFVTNKSSQARKLAAPPEAGLVLSVLGKKERQVVQFPEKGKFAVSAGGGSEMQVTVSGDSGCGTPEPTLTIKDGYAFSPAKLNVAATANFTVVNRSGAAHGILCDPDPGGNGDHTRLEKGETQILAFDKPGTYACHSVQHPEAKVAVTVH
jgi:plastocyanin